MAVKSGPVGEVLPFRLQAGFLQIGSEKTVGVIAQEHFDIEVHGVFETAVEQLHIVKRKLIAIESGLRRCRKRGGRHEHTYDKS